ncbi:hypothetical protein Hamer_G015225 [Homarus americanus]|uniref:Uncharacterized protein n=1 Tax=Homarus americanus TaxID=6706 RepID=A0A8J5N811_HOMAM|nr:hypothetical protein Hamer_G015225 [Homarus americanus]
MFFTQRSLLMFFTQRSLLMFFTHRSPSTFFAIVPREGHLAVFPLSRWPRHCPDIEILDSLYRRIKRFCVAVATPVSRL